MIQKRMPSLDITLIESEEIGILGAGEGTVVNFINFLSYVDIGLPEFFKKTNSTCKNGVKFTNWNGDSKYYYHNFTSDDLAIGSDTFNKYNVFSLLNTFNNIDPEIFDFVALANNNNKALVVPNNMTIKQVGQFAVHFDASMLAKFLKEKALERGVKRVEGKVSAIVNDENDYITSIMVGDNKISCDFVFDCTGFARMIIGNHYKTKWNSYSDYLPVNRAVPFFLNIDTENIEPYTEAIAMKYGWIWKIPLQHRYGCGYVFDSNYISEEEAAKEIEEYLGFVPEYPRKNKGGFKFDPGCFENVWVKNCFALGVASGFVEPLEATSFYTWLEFLKDGLSDLNALFSYNENYINDINKKWRKFNNEVMNFIYFHYITKRSDTDFWKKFQDIENAPGLVKEILNKWQYSLPRYDHFEINSPFIYDNWVKVGYGLGLLNSQLIKDAVISNKFDKDYSEKFLKFRQDRDNVAKNMLANHSVFIKMMGASHES
jgi:tryptophan halogenase